MKLLSLFIQLVVNIAIVYIIDSFESGILALGQNEESVIGGTSGLWRGGRIESDY